MKQPTRKHTAIVDSGPIMVKHDATIKIDKRDGSKILIGF